MQKKFCGLLVAACSVIALFALPVATADAALPVATTYKAVSTSPTTTYVFGIVVTEGQPAYYEFQYGTTSAYGSTTKVTTIAADPNVPYQFAYAELTGLKPGTTYHYRLAAYAGVGTVGYGYYYGGAGYGADATFTTPSAGSLALSSGTFGVAKGKAAFTLKCSSTIACKAKYSASYKGKYKGKTKSYSCFSGTASIKAGGSTKYTPKLSAACAYFVSHAKKQKLSGVSFTATASTGQARVNKKVTLKG
jgi:hypothetical protein